MHIEQRFNELIKILEEGLHEDFHSTNVYPTFGSRSEEEYILEKNGVYERWYSERGQDQLLFKSSDADEVLYEVFFTITLSLATAYESRHRNPLSEDTRIDWFPIQEKLLGKMSSKWEAKARAKHEALLKED